MTLDELARELEALERRGVPGVEEAIDRMFVDELGWVVHSDVPDRKSKLRLLIDLADGGFWILERVLDLTAAHLDYPHQPFAAPADLPRSADLALAAIERE